MDQFDRAQQIDQHYRQQALDAQLGKSSQGAARSRTHCIDCERTIPEGRRKAEPGCLRCVECQQEFEQRQRR